MPKDEKHEEISQRKTQADNEYFIGLFNWGATPRETEIAAEEYVYFKGAMDLTEAHDHKDDRWERFKQRIPAGDNDVEKG
ncbi:MAG: hypothetical protein GX349_03330 [Firmicutes bacterium]|nr:hypothetical protein [Bacillota bacterium]